MLYCYRHSGNKKSSIRDFINTGFLPNNFWK